MPSAHYSPAEESYTEADTKTVPEFGCELVVEETGVTRKYKRYYISEIITIAMVCIKKTHRSKDLIHTPPYSE